MKLTWTLAAGWSCGNEGPHGPTPCGPLEDGFHGCMCGCDDYYNGCAANMEYWEDIQANIDRNKESL